MKGARSGLRPVSDQVRVLHPMLAGWLVYAHIQNCNWLNVTALNGVNTSDLIVFQSSACSLFSSILEKECTVRFVSLLRYDLFQEFMFV